MSVARQSALRARESGWATLVPRLRPLAEQGSPQGRRVAKNRKIESVLAKNRKSSSQLENLASSRLASKAIYACT